MKIVIVGGGAIGRLFGVYCSKGGHQVTIVEPRSDVVQAINENGLAMMELGASSPDSLPHYTASAVDDAAAITECDLVLLAVKSFDTLQAIKQAAHLITENSPVISLQTGLGNIEIMERVVDRRHIIGGFTFMAATALSPGVVRHGGTGKTYIGELEERLSERVTALAEVFTKCGIPCTPVKRIIGRLWCKVIVYSAINALSSVLRVKNGQLLEQMESVTLLKRLIDEGKKIALANAVDLVFPDLYELLFEACKKTSGNLSSMLQDVLNHKDTEINAQCGALAAFGKESGINAPTQETMTELVKLIEKHQSRP